MKKGLITFVCLTTLVFLASCSKIKFSSLGGSGDELPSLKQGSNLATVNGDEIRQGYLDFLARVNPRIKGQMDNPATRKKILDSLVEQQLLYQESVKRGLDKQANVLEKAALYKRVIVSQSLLDAELEKQAKQYYDQNKETQFTKINISQIEIDFATPKVEAGKAQEPNKTAETAPTAVSIETAQKKALDIVARLKKGEDFGKVAEEVSDDKMTQKKGGDIGAISRDDKRMARLQLEALVPVAFSLKNGEISDPIETTKGFSIVKVTSDPQVTAFDEAEKIIDFQIQSQVKDTLLADLKKSAKIIYAESVSTPPVGTMPGVPASASVPGAPVVAPAEGTPTAPGATGTSPPTPQATAPAEAPAPTAAPQGIPAGNGAPTPGATTPPAQ